MCLRTFLLAFLSSCHSIYLQLTFSITITSLHFYLSVCYRASLSACLSPIHSSFLFYLLAFLSIYLLTSLRVCLRLCPYALSVLVNENLPSY